MEKIYFACLLIWPLLFCWMCSVKSLLKWIRLAEKIIILYCQQSNITSNLRVIHCAKCVQTRSYFWSVFSLNTGKYGPEIIPYLDTFHAVIVELSWLINSTDKMKNSQNVTKTIQIDDIGISVIINLMKVISIMLLRSKSIWKYWLNDSATLTKPSPVVSDMVPYCSFL